MYEFFRNTQKIFRNTQVENFKILEKFFSPVSEKIWNFGDFVNTYFYIKLSHANNLNIWSIKIGIFFINSLNFSKLLIADCRQRLQGINRIVFLHNISIDFHRYLVCQYYSIFPKKILHFQIINYCILLCFKFDFWSMFILIKIIYCDKLKMFLYNDW